MKKIIIVLLLAPFICIAQNTFKAVLKDSDEKEPLIGATAHLLNTGNGASSDVNGYIEIRDIPSGIQVIEFRSLGYETRLDTLIFPLKKDDIMEIFLKPQGEELEEIIVSSTRSSRVIYDSPTRIETVVGEELEEKAVSQPGNIKMILTESTGVQTQQTSAGSANTSIRIQGLDGKYTQLLKDGFPLYSGFSGGLSIMQITPLDLKQVEIIKGSTSTLYGGGAIAGLINLITKSPEDKKELIFLANGNQTKAGDLSTFYSQKFKKAGITLFASRNAQKAYDLNKDGFSDIPEQTRYNLNPKLFFYLSPKSLLSFGVNATIEDRRGGDMKVIEGAIDSVHSYFETNGSKRYSTQTKFETRLGNNVLLTLKNTIGYFDRKLTRSNYLFSGNQVSSFSEASLLIPKERSEWIAGINVWSDLFKERNENYLPLNSSQLIGGFFIQNNRKVNQKIVMDNGMRIDFTNRNNLFFLPRVGVMYKFSDKVTSRLGGGLGYKTPSVFSEEAESRGFQNIQPLDYSNVKPENSVGGNFDVNYKTPLSEEISLSFNQLFFYTRLINPVILSSSVLPNGNNEFMNANGYMDSKGIETNVKVRWDELALYTGYTYTDVRIRYNGINKLNPLTAKHRIYTTLMYEIEEKLRAGYELFYVGQQQLSNGENRPGYWVMGISAEVMWEHFSVFANAENFLNQAQQHYESMYAGTIQNPQFKEIWAPTDGFIFNAGIKIKI